ncbi:uncharacterized protein hoka [Venturia canescens]|uniref:uncharacterized protein hoka n=1 Tax=Venturia canescens TaxID=32260 RepID=UPI001C9C0E20|nr:uncharacterized protein LOC122419492 [Venturia canescens]
MRTKSVLYYLALGFLIMSLMMGEVEARRRILRGRKTITRSYYRPAGIPAWSIVVIAGIGMLAAGGGLYVLLKKTIIDGSDESGASSYHPAMQDEV